MAGPRIGDIGATRVMNPSALSLFKVSSTVLRAAQDSVTSVPTDG